MDARQLSNFLAIFDYGSVTRAARELYLAQPALSQSLRSLESELGVALFDRTPKGMTPTDAGYALVGPARQVLATASEIDRTLDGLRELRSGRLTLVCPNSLAAEPVADLVARFRHDHPGIIVQVTEPLDGESVSSTLLLGRADVGVDLLPHDEPRVRHLSLGTRTTVLVAQPEEWSAGDVVEPADLVDHPLVCGPAHSVLRGDVEQWFARAGVTMTVVVESDLEDGLHRLVRAGAGSAFVPGHRAAAARRAGLRVIEPQPALRREFGLLWLPASPSPAATAMTELAARHASGVDG